MIFIIFSLILIIYSFFNYKKAFMLYLVYKLILVTNMTVLSVPGIPLLTCEMFSDLSYLFIYLFKFGIPKKNTFPYIFPFCLLGITCFVASFFSIAGIISTVSELVRNIASDLLIIMIMWRIVETKKDFRFLFKWISIIIFISCIYGIWEQISSSNPYVEWVATFNHDPDKTNLWIYYNDTRGWRTQSIFAHAIGAGIIWSLWITAYLVLKVKYDVKFRNELFYFITMLLCGVCVIFTNSRTPLIFLLISVMGVFGYKNKKALFISMGAIFGILLFILNDNILANYFDSSKVGGSNLDMRLEQLNHAFNLFNMSPLTGLGYKFSSVINNADVEGLLGSESVIFQVLPTYGLIGIFTYLIYASYMCVIIPFKKHSFEMMMVSLAYWVACTVSSLPGFKMYLLWLFIFFLIKYPKVYKKSSSVYHLQNSCYRIKKLSVKVF